MSVSQGPHKPIENRLLAALPDDEYQRLVPHLERVSLSLNQVLYEPSEPIRYIYFPHQAIVSLVSTMSDGSTVEVGMVGHEGMVGLPVIWGGNSTTTCAFVQVPDSGMRMEATRLLAEFNRGGGTAKPAIALYASTAHAGLANGCLQPPPYRRGAARPLAANGL